MTQSISINHGGFTIYASFEERNIGTDLEFRGTRLITTDYRNYELVRLCNERALELTQSTVHAGLIISEINGLVDFVQLMQLTTELYTCYY